MAERPKQPWRADMTKVRGGPNLGWADLVDIMDCCNDCCNRDIVGWDTTLRCRTLEAIAAVERAVLEQMVDSSRNYGLVLNPDNGAQFTPSRFLEVLTQLGFTHRGTAFNYPEETA